MHEIITLQLGQKSSYLATHFWNTQESYFTYSPDQESEVNPNVHFRSGIGADGADTFTPRTLIYDLKGGFGTLRQYNALYEAQEEPSPINNLWDGNTVVQPQPTIEVHHYQQSLELGEPAPRLTAETVRFWSDFNRVYYHPKSIIQLNEYELNSQIMPFENWSAGDDLFSDVDKEIDILDRDLRPFAEECDQIDAFQIFATADDAWGGFAARYVDRIRDEYGKTSIWTFATEDDQPGSQVKSPCLTNLAVHEIDLLQRQRALRSSNAARTLFSVAPQTSAYVRLASPLQSTPSYIRRGPRSDWYSAGLAVAAMESVTLPSRVKSSAASLSALDSILNAEGNHTIFDLSATFKEAAVPKSSPQATLEAFGDQMLQDGIKYEGDTRWTASLDMNFTPPATGLPPKRQEKIFGMYRVFRGPRAVHEKLNELTRPEANGYGRDFRAEAYACLTPFPILDSFPSDLVDLPSTANGIEVISALTSSSKTASTIRSLAQVVQRFVALEDREYIANGLAEIGTAYADDWMSSDEDEDD